MLKKRVIPTLLLKGRRMVKGIRFDNYRDTGDPVAAVRIYSAQDADELVFINLDEGHDAFEALLQFVRKAAKECYMPLTVGGGVNSYEKAAMLFSNGADKVLINSAITRNPALADDIASIFGQQAVVAGVDYKISDQKRWVYLDKGKSNIYTSLQDHLETVSKLPVGEVLLMSIDHDGTMSGYDIDGINIACDIVRYPVICAGGAGNFMHLREVFVQTKVHAASCASIFHFGDNNPIRARSYLRNNGIPMRRIR